MSIKQEQESSIWRRIVLYTDKVLSRIEIGLVIIAAVLLFSMALIVNYAVLGRQFIDSAGSWAVEVSEYIMLFLTFLLAPWVLRNDGHVKVDLLLNALPSGLRALIETITKVIAIVAWGTLLWFSFNATIVSYQRGSILRRILDVPEYIILAVIPLGSLFLALRLIQQLAEKYSRNGSDKQQDFEEAKSDSEL